MTRVCDPDAAGWILRIHKASTRADHEEAGLEDLIAAARDAGCSWTVVGLGLGRDRTSAHRKWGARLAKRQGGRRA